MTFGPRFGRRGFLSAMGAIAISSTSSATTISADLNTPGSPFVHGVASGDPTQDSVLLWTRVSPATTALEENITVSWELSPDDGFSKILDSGKATASPDTDFTVTVDVENLEPGTQYFYRFSTANHVSRVGRTKTLPAGSPEAFRIAVVSCANYASGFFNVYRDIADRGDVDLVIHLGDYIYEEGLGGFGTQDAREIDRAPAPDKELVTLEDYRARYSQYRRDTDLQDLHASVPFVCVWDDHEIVNGTWSGGSLDHHEDTHGGWPERRDAAMRAYHEWLPLRLDIPSAQDRIFRSFEAGDLFKLSMLDTRHHGRDEILPRPDGFTSYVMTEIQRRFDGRSVLGDEQEQWLDQEVQEAASAHWHLLGQQFLVSQLDVPDLEPLLDLDKPSPLPRSTLEGFVSFSKLNPLFLNDSWDGYERAKQRFVEQLKSSQSSPIVLTGDIHMTLAADVLDDGELVAHELVTSSVTSPGMGQIFPSREKGDIDRGFEAQNEEVRHIESDHHGWLFLDITPATLTAEWRYVSGVLSRSFSSVSGQQAVIRKTPEEHRAGATTMTLGA